MSSPNPERSSGNSELPKDVMLEILLRLPVKTLLRFKCVCKNWNAVITSHHFMNQHYAHGSNKERLLVRCYKGRCCTYALSVDDTLSAFEEPARLQVPNKVWSVVGAENGVLLLIGKPRESLIDSSRELALFNPATRRLKILPPHRPYVTVEPNLQLCNAMFGFGFGLDPSSGDYKVVAIFHMWDIKSAESLHHPLVCIYNSGSDSWKHVTAFKSCPHAALSSDCNQYLNGVYYWAFGNASVLAFDMSTEKFEEIQISERVQSKIWQVCVRGGSLALLTRESETSDMFEVWVMEKERMWNRVAVFGPLPPEIWPCCFWKNDEHLLHPGSSVMRAYNIFTKQIRFPVAAQLEQENHVTS